MGNGGYWNFGIGGDLLPASEYKIREDTLSRTGLKQFAVQSTEFGHASGINLVCKSYLGVFSLILKL